MYRKTNQLFKMLLQAFNFIKNKCALYKVIFKESKNSSLFSCHAQIKKTSYTLTTLQSISGADLQHSVDRFFSGDTDFFIH